MVLKIFKMIATSGFLTALRVHQIRFRPALVLDPTGGAYCAPPDLDLVNGLRGTTSKGE